VLDRAPAALFSEYVNPEGQNPATPMGFQVCSKKYEMQRGPFAWMRGKAVAVGGERRAIIASASYEARASSAPG